MKKDKKMCLNYLYIKVFMNGKDIFDFNFSNINIDIFLWGKNEVLVKLI